MEQKVMRGSAEVPEEASGEGLQRLVPSPPVVMEPNTNGLDGKECVALLRRLVTDNREMINLIRQMADDIRHVHNLQHGIIQEMRNTILHQEYKELGPDKILEFTYDSVPIKMYLPTGISDLIQQSILQHRAFFHYDSLEMTRHYVPMSGEIVLDVGAYIGNHTVYYHKICGACKVHSFEPIPSSFYALNKNVEINEVNAVLYNFGLGSKEARARPSINFSNVGGSSLIEDESGAVIIRPLDSISLPHFTFMKIDVEGMAPEVLLGARDTILKYRPRLVVEAFPHEFERVNSILGSLGYTKHAQVADDFVYLP